MKETYGTSSPEFSFAVRMEFSHFGGKSWVAAEGENSRIAVIFDDYNLSGEGRVVKVPRDNDTATSQAISEYSMLELLERSNFESPYEFPRPIRIHEDPLYIVISAIKGEVLARSELRQTDQRAAGAAFAHMAASLIHVDTDEFREKAVQITATQRDWPGYFESLDSFNDRQYPTLSAAAAEMRRLRDRYLNNQAQSDGLLINGDMRLINLVFAGLPARAVKGLLDWSHIRLGSIAEAMRGVFELGMPGLEGCNQELIRHGIQPVDFDAIKFWNLGRCVVSTIEQIRSSIPDPDEYMFTREQLHAGYPGEVWDEMPPVEVPRSYTWFANGPDFPRQLSV